MDIRQLGRCLSDPTRLRILDLIALEPSDCCPPGPTGGICVCEIVDRIGTGQSRVSYHLAELRAAGLVSETTHGRWKYYRLNREVFDTLAAELAEKYGQGKEELL